MKKFQMEKTRFSLNVALTACHNLKNILRRFLVWNTQNIHQLQIITDNYCSPFDLFDILWLKESASGVLCMEWVIYIFLEIVFLQ
jgi:hypothetical protein